MINYLSIKLKCVSLITNIATILAPMYHYIKIKLTILLRNCCYKTTNRYAIASCNKAVSL